MGSHKDYTPAFQMYCRVCSVHRNEDTFWRKLVWRIGTFHEGKHASGRTVLSTSCGQVLLLPIGGWWPSLLLGQMFDWGRSAHLVAFGRLLQRNVL